MFNFLKKIFLLFLCLYTTQAMVLAQQNLLIVSDYKKNIPNHYFIYSGISNLISSEIENEINKGNKVKAININNISTKLEKKQIENFINSFKYTNTIDYKTLKQLGKEANCSKVLIVNSNVDTQREFLHPTIWYKLSIAGETTVKSALVVNSSFTLIDILKESVLWQYSCEDIVKSKNQDIIPISTYENTQMFEIKKQTLKTVTDAAKCVEYRTFYADYPGNREVLPPEPLMKGEIVGAYYNKSKIKAQKAIKSSKEKMNRYKKEHHIFENL